MSEVDTRSRRTGFSALILQGPNRPVETGEKVFVARCAKRLEIIFVAECEALFSSRDIEELWHLECVQINQHQVDALCVVVI